MTSQHSIQHHHGTHHTTVLPATINTPTHPILRLPSPHHQSPHPNSLHILHLQSFNTNTHIHTTLHEYSPHIRPGQNKARYAGPWVMHSCLRRTPGTQFGSISDLVRSEEPGPTLSHLLMLPLSGWKDSHHINLTWWLCNEKHIPSGTYIYPPRQLKTSSSTRQSPPTISNVSGHLGWVNGLTLP